mgnify:CR=1 FL=1
MHLLCLKYGCCAVVDVEVGNIDVRVDVVRRLFLIRLCLESTADWQYLAHHLLEFCESWL